MQGQGLPGFRDFYPEQLALRNHIFATWREVARRYAFQEYDGPPLEPLELYTRKSGDEIVPQLFRYERQQRGRLREHFQLNMDIVGEAGPAADAEVMAAAVDIMRAFGFGPADVRLRVSDRRVVAAQLTERYGVAADELAGVLAALDKWERAPDETERLLGDALRADAARVRPVLEFVAGLRRSGDELRRLPVAASLNECLARLEAMGLGAFVELDFTVVRGLAYYTGVVFELFDAARAFRAICGGGRYDTLMRELAGVDLPCVGFGMGDVVLGELLKERGAPPGARPALDAFLVAVSDEDVPPLLGLAHELRERGMAVEYGLRAAPVRKQLELAAARGAPRAVIVGPAERAAGVAVVRDLATGAEARVPLARLREGRFRP